MQKKILKFFLILGIAFLCPINSTTYTLADDNDENVHYTCFVRKELTEESRQLNKFLAKYFYASENHELDSLKKLYSQDFISGDGFNREKLFKMIDDSWKLSPDLSYSGRIQDLKFDKTFATVEINEDLSGLTKKKSEITDDTGFIESSSRTILYLRKFGKGWRIISDKTLYEETSIKYGEAKDLDINLYAPPQVTPEDNYTISLETEIPENMFAVSSIIKEKLSFPKEKKDEVFRQVPISTGTLERVVKANNNSMNELAVASVSFCNVKKDNFKRPDIDFAGTAVLIKRVNVLNINKVDE